ncbi:hypothetical protein OOK36_15855 [Streptomyces sp. NBC_00365]|uniref:hypothetical protein n=1 Tax=Streptomyces sp. NBC_00365 TaxID=2975726 RepID=UPI00224F439B|nr:hypothetical protein [Streptomyces sp. NBC_00365]MCX5090354.1 hypothetical protein [Streptomyces sp. NBC_00365]
MSKFSAGKRSVGAGRLGKIPGGFEPLLRIGKLPIDAPGAGGQRHGDADPGPFRHLGGREPVVLDVLSQDARQRGMPRRAACLALGAALQVTFLVNLSGVGPLLADLRGSRVDQQLTPLVPGVEAGKRHVLHAHGYGFLGSQSAVAQRGEERVRPLSSTGPAPDPVEECRRLVRIHQGPLVHGVAGLGDSR